MDTTYLLTFTFMSLLLVISPGPNGVLILKTVPTSGPKAGFLNVAGFVAAFYLHGAFSIFGLSAILMQSAHAFFVIKIIGAAYLCWVGFKALYEAFKNKSINHPITSPKKRKASNTKCFLEGFLTNALNPKVSMFYLAAFPQFISVTKNVVQTSLTLVFIHSTLNALWFSLMVIFLSKAGRLTQRPFIQRFVKATTGFVFIGFGTKLALMKSS